MIPIPSPAPVPSPSRGLLSFSLKFDDFFGFGDDSTDKSMDDDALSWRFAPQRLPRTNTHDGAFPQELGIGAAGGAAGAAGGGGSEVAWDALQRVELTVTW